MTQPPALVLGNPTTDPTSPILYVALAQRTPAATEKERRVLLTLLTQLQAAQQLAPLSFLDEPSAGEPAEPLPLASFRTEAAGEDRTSCYELPTSMPLVQARGYLLAFLAHYAAWTDRALTLHMSRPTAPHIMMAQLAVTTRSGERALLRIPCGAPSARSAEQLNDLQHIVFHARDNSDAELKGLAEFVDLQDTFDFRVPPTESLPVKEKAAREFWAHYAAYEPYFRVSQLKSPTDYYGYVLLKTHLVVDTGADVAPVALCLLLARHSKSANEDEYRQLHWLLTRLRDGLPTKFDF